MDFLVCQALPVWLFSGFLIADSSVRRALSTVYRLTLLTLLSIDIAESRAEFTGDVNTIHEST